MQTNLPKNARDIFPIKEAAAYLGVSRDTLRRWDKAGKIHSVRTAGNIRRFPKEELDSVKNASKKEFLSIGQAAIELSVSIQTLRRWDKQGLIKPGRNEIGERVFPRELIEHIKAINEPKTYALPIQTAEETQAPRAPSVPDKFHKKVIHHIKHTRPAWYHRYHERGYVRTIHLVILVIFLLLLGSYLFDILIVKPRLDKIALSSTNVDASLLSGLKAEDFLRSNTSDTFETGTLTTAEGTALLISGTFECVDCITDQAVIDGLTISGGTINNTPIGAISPFTGSFTSLSANAGLSVSSGTATFSSLDCTSNLNGGSLTTDAFGLLTCSNDDAGGAGATDHGVLTGLLDDDHTQYAFLSGRAGGQVLNGGTLTGQTLTLRANAVDTSGILTLSGNSPHAALIGDLDITGDLQVNGDDILDSGGSTRITFNGVGGFDVVLTALASTTSDLWVGGNLIVVGGQIKDSGTTTRIYLNSTGAENITFGALGLDTIAIDSVVLRLGAIQLRLGASQITNATATQLYFTFLPIGFGPEVTVNNGVTSLTNIAGDLRVTGNDIQDSGGTARITLATASPHVNITGDLDVSENIIFSSSTAFNGSLDHGITSDRTWTFPDSTGTIALTTDFGTKIQDADADTKIDVEESPDEDIIRMDVASTERFVLQDSSPHLTITGNTAITGQVGIGNEGVSSAPFRLINISPETASGSTNFLSTFSTAYTFTGVGTFISQVTAGTVDLAGNNSQVAGFNFAHSVVDNVGGAVMPATFAIGMGGGIGISGSAFTITEGMGMRAFLGGAAAWGSNVTVPTISAIKVQRLSSFSAAATTGRGVWVQNVAHGGMTTAIALDIEAQSGADTTTIGARIALATDYALQMSDTGGTAAGGITFGTDTTLYRSAVNQLKTDDNLEIDGNFTVGNNATPNSEIVIFANHNFANDISTNVNAQQFTVSLAQTSASYLNKLVGIRVAPFIGTANTQDWTNTVGLRGFAASLTNLSTAGTITGMAGFYVESMTDIGTVTNGYGMYIEALTAGVNNYGIFINTPTGTIADAIHVVGGRAFFGGSAVVADALAVNEDGGDNDTRIEGATDNDLLFVDAGLDTITIGSQTSLGKFGIDGDQDEIQLLVQGNSSQTSNVFEIEDSGASNLLTVSNGGLVTLGSGALRTHDDGIEDRTGAKRIGLSFIFGALDPMQILGGGLSIVDAGDFTVINGGAAIFNTLRIGSATLDPDALVRAAKNIAPVTATLYGGNFAPTNIATSGVKNTVGISGIATWSGTGTSSSAYVRALDFSAQHNSANTLTELTAIRALLAVSPLGTGLLTNATGILIPSPTWGGSEPTTIAGIDIFDLGHPSIANLYALRLRTQTAATTLTLRHNLLECRNSHG